MLTIRITRPEALLLTQMLQDAWNDLRVEVRHTDRLDFKEELKERERMVQGLIIKLQSDKVKVAAG
jgi:hypothetical protein